MISHIKAALLFLRDEFEKKPPIDLTGATDGYGGNWASLPVGETEDGQPYLTPGALPDLSGLRERRP